MSGRTAPDAESIEGQVNSEVRERFDKKRPSGDEQAELLRQHKNHLVRDTLSQLAVDQDIEVEGIEISTTIKLPDTFCFTCNEWVGLSGVELAGRPRSRTDAYWLDGPPEAVNGLQNDLVHLASHLSDELEHVEGLADALGLIMGESERLQDRAAIVEGDD